MPFCVGDGAVDPATAEFEEEDDDVVVLVGVVELLKGAVKLLDATVPLPPACCPPALIGAIDTLGGT